MQVRFWGTRGSLPAALQAKDIRKKIKAALVIAVQEQFGPGKDMNAFIDNELPFWVRGTYGTNTSCIEIRDGSDFILCDAGSGLRDFGNHLIRNPGENPSKDFHILISHLHWDHIQGFPFFLPSYSKGNRITFYGCHEDMKDAFVTQQSAPLFPVDFNDLGADNRFVKLIPGKTYDISGFRVTAKEQSHPGKSYGYRIERNGKTVVYSTDSEHKSETDEDSARVVEFFRNADLLIFDAQYSLTDACTVKEDWGHSNNVIGAEFAQRAGVKHLCLYHNEPSSSDEDLDRFLEETKKLAFLLGEGTPPEVSIARDGMIVEI
jgi:phosphoribosyl 1,2-cyclic phosphodiesterase